MAALNVSADLVPACTIDIDGGGGPGVVSSRPSLSQRTCTCLARASLNLAKLTSTKKNLFDKYVRMSKGEDVELAEDEIVAVERYVAANNTESAFEAKEELVCYIFMDKLVDEHGACGLTTPRQRSRWQHCRPACAMRYITLL